MESEGSWTLHWISELEKALAVETASSLSEIPSGECSGQREGACRSAENARRVGLHLASLSLNIDSHVMAEDVTRNDPSGLVKLPGGSVRLEEPEEETPVTDILTSSRKGPRTSKTCG